MIWTKYIWKRGTGDNNGITFDGFSIYAKQLTSIMLYDVDRFTGEAIKLPLGFKILTCKEGDHVSEVVVSLLTEFDECMKRQGLRGLPYLARIAHGVFDRGHNENAAFRNLSEQILKLRDHLRKSGFNIAKWDRILVFACNSHANASKLKN